MEVQTSMHIQTSYVNINTNMYVKEIHIRANTYMCVYAHPYMFVHVCIYNPYKYFIHMICIYYICVHKSCSYSGMIFWHVILGSPCSKMVMPHERNQPPDEAPVSSSLSMQVRGCQGLGFFQLTYEGMTPFGPSHSTQHVANAWHHQNSKALDSCHQSH